MIVNYLFKQLRQAYIDWIFELAEKLKITQNTSHLAIHLLDILMFKDTSHNPQLQLFAPVSLLVAGFSSSIYYSKTFIAKTVELDERIPFIPKLRKLANPIFSLEEFKKAEVILLENVDWNPQYSTLIELIEFYLSKGIVNSTDEIELESESSFASSSVLKEKNRQISNGENKEIVRQDLELIKPNASSKENNENAYKVTVANHVDVKAVGISDFLLAQDTTQEPAQKSTLYKKRSSNILSDESAFDRNKDKKTEIINANKIEYILSSLEKDAYKLVNLVIKGKFTAFLTNQII